MERVFRCAFRDVENDVPVVVGPPPSYLYEVVTPRVVIGVSVATDFNVTIVADVLGCTRTHDV